MTLKKRKCLSSLIIAIIGIIVMIIIAFPVLWLLRTALVPPVRLYENPPPIFFKPSFVSFPRAIWLGSLSSRFLNSVIISVISTVLGVFLGVMAGYGITRFYFPLTKNIHIVILFNRMIPGVAILLPVFIMFSKMHIIDTKIGMILVYSSGQLSTVIWMAWGYFRTMPKEIEESAYIDGYGSFRVFLQIILPVSTPIVASVAILSFTGAWNDFMMATILTRNRAATLPPGVVAMMGQTDMAWDQLSAAGIMVSIPLILLCIFAQKYFIRGLTAGSVKG
jgi:multiple sugar transport system permease protein